MCCVCGLCGVYSACSMHVFVLQVVCTMSGVRGVSGVCVVYNMVLRCVWYLWCLCV